MEMRCVRIGNTAREIHNLFIVACGKKQVGLEQIREKCKKEQQCVAACRSDKIEKSAQQSSQYILCFFCPSMCPFQILYLISGNFLLLPLTKFCNYSAIENFKIKLPSAVSNLLHFQTIWNELFECKHKHQHPQHPRCSLRGICA